jgi:hypothetical protein
MLRPRCWQRHPQALANGRRDSTKEARGSDRLPRRRLRADICFRSVRSVPSSDLPKPIGLQSPESTVQTAIFQTA